MPQRETSRKVMMEGTGPKKMPPRPDSPSGKPLRLEELLPKKKA